MAQTPALPQANMQARWHQGLLFYTFPHFDAQAGLRHGFSTRLGGVSEGPCASLNLGFTQTLKHGDSTARVAENLRRFGAAVGFSSRRLVLTQQTHSANIHYATEADAGRGVARPLGYTDIDGLITATPQLPLLTYHADCTPLFFYAPRQHMAGLAHAGWRGTAADMAGAMVRALCQAGCSAEELLVGIGPAAGPCHYQVGPEVAQTFAQIRDEAGAVTTDDPAQPGRYLLDLWRANRALLLQAGVLAENIVIGGLCTICHPELFFSHRVQGEQRGTLAAAIMLES